MDKNGMITISSKDWSNYPMVEKTESVPEIILYWKHSTVSSAQTGPSSNIGSLQRPEPNDISHELTFI